jgi:histidine ammonia-lyase
LEAASPEDLPIGDTSGEVLRPSGDFLGGIMTVVIGGRVDLTLENFARVVWGREKAVLGPAVRRKVEDARAGFLRYCANNPDEAIYGVTSGYGQNARRRLSIDEAGRFHSRTLAVGAMSFGDPLPTRQVRGILFARLANLIDGHGATSHRVVSAVVEMLNGDRPVPDVPRDGNGCAGEILPLYHLFAPLSDEFRMEIKEKGPLTNGAPCAAALLADGVLAARPRWDLACEIFALSVEAFKAPLEAYDPALAGFWNDPDAGHALARFQILLVGAAPFDRRSYQAPVSYRVLPRLLGRASRSVRVAAETAETILPAVTDNPIYSPPDADFPDGRSFSTGGFHDSHAVPAMDALSASFADLCLIAERHVSKLLDGHVSGLPDKLMADPALVAGGASALSYAPMAAVGFLEQARSAATTTLLPGSEGGAFGQDDVVSPVFQAWDKHERVGLAFERTLAILAAVASQALWVTGRSAPAGLSRRIDAIRSVFPPVDDVAPRILGHDCARLAAAFRHEIHGDAAAML